MAQDQKLPALVKGGDRIATTTTTVVGAMVDAFVPGAGTVFSQLCGHLIQKRMEDASQLLIEELRMGKVENLAAEKYTCFVPMGYQFFDAARRGESVKKLRLLARFLAGSLADSDPSPDEFIRISAKIEMLSNKDIEVMSSIYLIHNEGKFKEAKSSSRKGLMYFEVDQIDSWNWVDASSSISALVAAGLIVPDGQIIWGKSGEFYYLTTDFVRICKFAVEKTS
jgi:hypothetical protein